MLCFTHCLFVSSVSPSSHPMLAVRTIRGPRSLLPDDDPTDLLDLIGLGLATRWLGLRISGTPSRVKMGMVQCRYLVGEKKMGGWGRAGDSRRAPRAEASDLEAPTPVTRAPRNLDRMFRPLTCASQARIQVHRELSQG